jgi:predicted PurR-regulated permease PerM
MKKISDELLNDYIDNQLDSKSLKEIADAVKIDAELLIRLTALKKVDTSLNEIEVIPAPDGFTNRIMKLIIAQSKIIIPKVSYFFVSVVSVFVTAIFSVSVVAFATLEKSQNLVKKNSLLQDGMQYLKEIISSLQIYLSNDSILKIGLFLSIILLISGYFLLESHKNFRNKLNKLPTR